MDEYEKYIKPHITTNNKYVRKWSNMGNIQTQRSIIGLPVQMVQGDIAEPNVQKHGWVIFNDRGDAKFITLSWQTADMAALEGFIVEELKVL